MNYFCTNLRQQAYFLYWILNVNHTSILWQNMFHNISGFVLCFFHDRYLDAIPNIKLQGLILLKSHLLMDIFS